MTTINILYKKITISLFIGLCSSLLYYNFKNTDHVNYLNIIGVIIFLSSLFFMSYNAIKLFRILPGLLPLNAFLIGVFLLAGSAIVDMGATVICSPDLQQEGNVFILMLLREQFSLGFIYCFAFALNILAGSLQLILWACFLKIYPTMIQSIPYKNMFTTYKWLMGSGEKKGLKAFLNVKTDLHFGLPSCIFLIIMQSLYRFYMALMWFNLVPHSFTVVPLLILIASILGLTFISHYKIKQLHLSIGNQTTDINHVNKLTIF